MRKNTILDNYHWISAAAFITLVYFVFYYDEIVNFIAPFFLQPGLSSLMQNIGLAILAIFIPVAIFLFDEKETLGFKRLDKVVVLDYLIRAQSLIWKIALIFVPLLFWEVVSSDSNAAMVVLRLILFLLWLTGVTYMFDALANAYSWIRNDRFRHRFKLLKQATFNSELEQLWRSVWESSETNTENEIEFLKIFSSHTEAFIENEQDTDKLFLLAKLLNDFQILIRKRPDGFLILRNGILESVLQWHHVVWEKTYTNLNTDETSSTGLHPWAEYDEVLRILGLILEDITKKILEGRHVSIFTIVTNNHVKKYQELSIGKHEYLETFLEPILSPLFSNLQDKKQSYKIWTSFPNDWLVTVDRLSESKVPWVVFGYFVNWARDRILEKPSGEFDFVLDETSRSLFPNTDPKAWATILTFCFRSWGPKSRMISLLENPRSFGHIGRIQFGAAPSRKSFEDRVMRSSDVQLDNALQLAFKLFSAEFTQERVSACLEELREADPTEELKQYHQELLIYWERMLELLAYKQSIL